MKTNSCVKTILTALCILLFIAGCGQKIEYPITKTGDVVDDYHGTQVADPYRWLEDDNAEDTKAWVTAQNEVTFNYLNRIPQRDKIKTRLTELWNYEKFDAPENKGGRYFFKKNDGLQNQSVLYVQESLDAEARVLFDPNKLSEDGTIAMSTWEVSPDGSYLAYALSSGGSDWRELHVREIATGKDLDDHIKWVKFSGISWSKDSKGFYYSRFPEAKEGQEMTQQNKFKKIYFHKVGKNQKDDILVYEDPTKPDWGFYTTVSDDGKNLVIDVTQGTDRRNRLYTMQIGRNYRGRVTKIFNDFDAGYSYIGNQGNIYYFQTDKDAPKGRIIAVDIRRPAKRNWKEIIPEKSDVLSDVDIINNQLVTVYMHDAHDQVHIHNLNGSFVSELPLPTLGSVSSISGKKEDTEMFFEFYSFAYPPTVFRYDFEKKEGNAFRTPNVLFNPEEFETRQLFFESKDGTRVPMFITYKKGIVFKGQTPTYLYGYGGFNISLTPRFSISNMYWMESGGIFAQVNLRGGGEYGMDWYHQGILDQKQNVFDDFIAAAEYLIAEGYTSSSKLAIGGASNGGLLVGACMTQRPDLIGAALPAVGVLDMLRYHNFTIGWAWASDYGRSDNPDHFDFLHAYSPLHNLKEGVAYPATMVTTADHDDRVVPAHSFKFAAKLQSVHAGNAPVLIRIETRAGHGSGKPTSKRIEEAADKWAFLVKNLKM